MKPTDCSIPDDRSLDERLKLDVDVRDIGKLHAVADRAEVALMLSELLFLYMLLVATARPISVSARRQRGRLYQKCIRHRA